MSIMKGRALEFEIINTPGKKAKAIVTKIGDYRDIAYIHPTGDITWAVDQWDYMNSPTVRNDMLTIMTHIRLMNGYTV